MTLLSRVAGMFLSLGIPMKNGETIFTPSPSRICRSHIRIPQVVRSIRIAGAGMPAYLCHQTGRRTNDLGWHGLCPQT